MKLTKAELIAAIADKYGKVSPAELADNLNVSINTVYTYAHSLGLKRYKELTYGQKVEILSLKAKRVPNTTISLITGIGSHRINKFLLGLNLPAFPPWNEEMIRQRMSSHDSYTSFRVDDPACYNWLRVHNRLEEAKKHYDRAN